MRKYILILVILLILIAPLSALQIYPVQIDKNGVLTFSIEVKNAQTVSIAGNFNDWSADKNLLSKDELGVWSISLKLNPGKYEYKFVINGNKWVPENNLKLEIVNKYGHFILKGGKGYTERFEKKSNLGKINDKIFINGYYKLIMINSIFKNKIHKIDNRHILNITPGIYFSNNVYGKFTLNIDTSTANYLNYWKGELALYSDYTALYIFNNEQIINFNEPLHSLDIYKLYSKYPIFNNEISFYNEREKSELPGKNLRGALFKTWYKKVDFSFLIFRPNFKNQTVTYINLKYGSKNKKIGYLNIIERGIYENNEYIEPNEYDWDNSPYDSDVWYYFDKNLYYGISDKYYIYKNGIFFNYKISNPFTLFGEFLYKKKEGGYFAKTLYSSGKDLPLNYINYPQNGVYNYDKFIYFFENEYSGREFIIGTHLLNKISKHEISFSLKSYQYVNVPAYNMRYITPSYRTLSYISFFFFSVKNINFKLSNKVNYTFCDNSIRNYNYLIPFDENNFFNRFMEGAYKKLSIRNQISINVKKLNFILDNLYNKYFQHDIYFETGDNWISESIEFFIKIHYNLNKKSKILLSTRFKNYFYKRMIEKNIFLTFNKLYINPFVEIKYSIMKNVNLALDYGLNPKNDIDNSDGLYYYLNNNLDKNFPFFKTAEDNVRNNQFIGIKAIVRF